MNEVILHGELGERFGVIPPLDVRDPAEAIRALTCQLPGFGNVLRNGNWYVILEGEDGKFALNPDGMQLGIHAKKMHILPEVMGLAAGAKGKGTAKLLIGIALVGASLVIPGMQGFGLAAAKGAWASTIAGTGITFGHMALAGVALAFAGAAMLTAPQPKMPSADSSPDTNSFIFNGNNKPSGQGLAVPCVWGIFRAVPIPVATRIQTDQISIGGGVGGAVGSSSGYTNYPSGYSPISGMDPEMYALINLMNPLLAKGLAQ